MNSCIISFLYIKPQLSFWSSLLYSVVLYRFSTSNHNKEPTEYGKRELYYIVSLHQTTTVGSIKRAWEKLYYIVSLHQTTTYLGGFDSNIRCIISFLYIKPQLMKYTKEVKKSCIISFLYIKPQPFLV